MVGGAEKVFELNRNFRNEGADATHNPEFTMLEAYEAYGDYDTMQALMQEMIQQAARAALGGTVVVHDGREHDLGGEWRSITVNDAISDALGEEVTADTSVEQLRRFCDQVDVPLRPGLGPRRGGAGALRAPGRGPHGARRRSTATSRPTSRR